MPRNRKQEKETNKDKYNDDMAGTEIADRRNFISVAVFLVGVVLLLPWNMTTTVSGYWEFKFRNVTPVPEDDVTDDDDDPTTKTELQKMFYAYLSIAMTVPNAVTIILHAVFGHMVGMRLRIFGTKVRP